MNSENTRPRTVHDQLLALSALTGKVRAELEAGRHKPSKDTLEDLQYLQVTLEQVGGKIEVFQREHGNMLALAEIGLVWEDVPEELRHGDGGLSLMSLIGTLWKAVQELSAEVEALKSGKPGGEA
jgi:hypothetical protein